MATLIFGILVACLLALLLVPRPGPTIIYVQQEPEAPALASRLGCLPLIVLGILLLLALRLI